MDNIKRIIINAKNQYEPNNFYLKLKCLDMFKIGKNDRFWFEFDDIIIIKHSRFRKKPQKHIIPLKNVERISYDLPKDYKWQRSKKTVEEISRDIASKNELRKNNLLKKVDKDNIKNISDEIVKQKQEEEEENVKFEFKHLNDEEMKDLLDLMEKKNLKSNVDRVKKNKMSSDEIADDIVDKVGIIKMGK